MTEPEIYIVVNEIFSDIFLREDIELTATTSASDIEGWDSFKQIEIVMAVEEHFGIKLQTREIDRLENVGKLVEVIAKKTQRA